MSGHSISMQLDVLSKRELRRTDLYKNSLVQGKHRLCKADLLSLLHTEQLGFTGIIKAYQDVYPVKEAINKYVCMYPTTCEMKLSHELRIVGIHELFKGRCTKVKTEPGILRFKAGVGGCIWTKGKGELHSDEGSVFTQLKLFNLLHADSWINDISGKIRWHLDIINNQLLPECVQTQKFLNHFVIEHLEEHPVIPDEMDFVPPSDEEDITEDEDDDFNYERYVLNDSDKENDNVSEPVTTEKTNTVEEIPEEACDFYHLLGEDMEFNDNVITYSHFDKTITEVSEVNKVIPKFDNHTFLMFFTTDIPQIDNIRLISRTKVNKYCLWKIVDSSDADCPQDVGRAVLLDTFGLFGLFGNKLVSEIGIFTAE